MKKSIRRVLIGIGAAAGLGVLIYLFSTLPFRDVLAQFEDADAWSITGFILSVVFIQVMMTWRWRVVLQSRGMDTVPFWNLNNIRLIGAAISFLTPSAKLGGEPVRAFIHHKKSEYDLKKSMSSVVIDKTVDLASNGVFFVVGGLCILASFTLTQSWQNIIIGFSLVLGLLIALFLYRVSTGRKVLSTGFSALNLDRFEKLQKPLESFREVEELVVDFYHQDREAFGYAAFISALIWLGTFFEYYFAALIIGAQLSLLQIFLVFTFIGIAYLIPVPMALGTLEAGQVSVFSLIGLGRASGLGLSLVVRAKEIVIGAWGLTCLALTGIDLRKAMREAKEVQDEHSSSTS